MLLGVDYSSHQRPLPWESWKDVTFVIGRSSIGYRQDSVWPREMERARDAGKKYRAAYGVILHHDSEIPFFDPVRQCQIFISTLIPGLVTLAMLDIEARGVTEAMVWAWISHYRKHGPLPLILYGNKELENILGINNPRYNDFEVMCADYGPGIITSTPPIGPYPRFPRVGKNRGRLWQFAGDNGRLPPYQFPIDLSRFDGSEAELADLFGVRSFKPMNPFTPDTSKGSKIGLHVILPDRARSIVENLASQDTRMAGVLGVENAGILVETKRSAPQTPTFWRLYTPQWDGLDDIHLWSDLQITLRAEEIASYAVNRWNALQPEEKNSIDLIVLLNEADPIGDVGYANYGKLCRKIVELCAGWGLRVALPAFNFGTPEWSEMIAFANSGATDAIALNGGALVVHEGVNPFSDDPLTFGPIPGAPAVAGAGPTAFRYRYLYHYLKQAGKRLPWLVVGEFYAGAGYDPSRLNDQLGRFLFYDGEVRKDSYVVCFLGFTVDPSGGWNHQDYNYLMTSPEMTSYLVREKDQPNKGEDTGELTMSQKERIKEQLAVIDAAVVAINAILDEKPWPTPPFEVFAKIPCTLYSAPDGAPIRILTDGRRMDVWEVRNNWLRVTQAPLPIYWVRGEEVTLR